MKGIEYACSNEIVIRAKKDLDELSALGHFLKGSSATLGFNLVKDECEKIQHYGHKKDETGTTDIPDTEECLKLIKESKKKAVSAFAIAQRLMRQYYDQFPESAEGA